MNVDREKPENNKPLVASSPPPYAYYPPEDEINLADLWWVLVKRKYTLIGVTAFVTLGALLYALQATPVYRAEAIFLPPTAGDIQELIVFQDIESFNVSSVYTKFEQNLSARPPRKTVFDDMNLLDQFAPEREPDESIDEIFSDFNETLTITTPKVKKDETPIPTITFAMEWEDPLLIAQVVNRIGKETERATALEIISDIQATIDSQVKDLNQEIKLLREKAIKQRQDEIERLETADALERESINDKIASLRSKALGERLDKITKLKEATGIAHSLEIKDPIGYKLKKISDATEIKSQILTGISDSAQQVYTRGYEALDAEIESLANRTVDDPYIPELRGLQEKLTLLEHNRTVDQLKSRENDDPFIETLRDKENELARLASIEIDPAAVKTARLDQAAYAPEQRIKPNRKLIVILGLMLGLMLGVFTAFFVNFIANQKDEQAEA